MSCNKVIASVYEKYLKEIELQSDKNEHVDLGKILDSLGIHRYCCRRMIISNVDMFETLIHYN